MLITGLIGSTITGPPHKIFKLMLIFSDMKDVKLLLNATKYLSNFRGDTFVVKLGGEIFYDEKTMKSIVKDIATLSIFGINIAVVHGAGREISKRMEEFGMKPKFIDGLRYTDEKTMLFVIGALKTVSYTHLTLPTN